MMYATAGELLGNQLPSILGFLQNFNNRPPANYWEAPAPFTKM